jgi:putative lipoprotein
MRCPRRSAWGAALAALLLARSSLAQQADPWWGPDKRLHFTFSAAIAGATYGGAALTYPDRSSRLLWGGAVAAGAGIGKEVYDLSGRGDPSWRDLTWDALGVAAGLGVALLIDLALRGPTPATTPAR